jgi:hypothetical protein
VTLLDSHVIWACFSGSSLQQALLEPVADFRTWFKTECGEVMARYRFAGMRWELRGFIRSGYCCEGGGRALCMESLDAVL